MRVCFVSEFPPGEEATGEKHRLLHTMLPALMTLAQDGHTIYWLSSLSSLASVDSPLAGLHPCAAVLPPTCHYVLPCQGYTLAGLRVLDIAAAIWQDAALHTRLFTFLRLFQHAVQCDVWHVWGTLPIVYLVVYTGRLLQVPVVVAYHEALLHDSARQPFLWEWVGQHMRHMVVTETASPGLPSPARAFPHTSLHTMALDASLPVSQVLAAMYARVAPALLL